MNINESMTLAECLEYIRHELKYFDHPNLDTVGIEESLDRIEELTRWIPVEERLPDAGDIVLVKGTRTGEVCKPYPNQMGLVEWGHKDYSLCVDGCYYSVWYSEITEWKRF